MLPERAPAVRSPLPGLFLLALFTGCAYSGTARDFDPARLRSSEGWVAIQGVPVIRQRGEQDCGAAALAMILTYWEIPSSIDDVTYACGPPPGEGVDAGALRDHARALGMEAFLIRGELTDLDRELSMGRPVLVGMVKPHTGGVRSHYEVVVGLHASRGIVLTIDPAHGWRENTLEGFLQEWEGARRLMIVVL